MGLRSKLKNIRETLIPLGISLMASAALPILANVTYDDYSHVTSMRPQVLSPDVSVETVNMWVFRTRELEELALALKDDSILYEILEGFGDSSERIPYIPYLLFNTFDYVDCDGNRLTLHNTNTGRGFDTNCVVSVPHEISDHVSRSSPLNERLETVQRYIRSEFTYDPISDSDLEEGGDLVQTIAEERRSICTGSNIYGALLLHQLGVDDIRLATGLTRGEPHMWTEVDVDDDTDDQDWRVYDMTPSAMSDELTELLGQPQN